MKLELVLVLLCTLTKALAPHCSKDCKCYSRDGNTFADCNTVDLNRVVSAVSPNTTHLLVVLQSIAYLINSSDFSPSFSHLVNLEVLILDHDGLYCFSKVRIQRSSFPQLTKLRVFMSRLQLNFSADTFARMTLLESLTLSKTAEKWEIFPQLMTESLCKMQRLRKLDLTQFSTEMTVSSIQENFKPEMVFAGCRLPNVEELRLRGNSMGKVFSTFYVPFPSLSVLDISYNELMKINAIEGVESMVIFLFNVYLHTFDCGHQMTPYRQHEPYTAHDLTTQLDIPRLSMICNRADNEYWGLRLLGKSQSQRTSKELKMVCISFQKLIAPSLHGSSDMHLMSGHLTNTDILIPHLHLQYIDFSDNAQFMFVHMENVRFPSGLEHVEFLNLRRNNLKQFHHIFFSSMPSLQTLLLGYNNLGPKLSTLNVKENDNLEELDLAYNNISQFPCDTLEGMSSLKQLNFTGNNISDFNTNIRGLVHLRLLNLSDNNIKTLSSSMTAELDGLVELNLDISQNPLSCKCEDIQFIDWLKSTKVTIYNKQLLTCQDSSNGVHTLGTLDLDDVRSKCFPNTVRTIAISTTVTFIITTTLFVFVLVYCKRWRLRYWWYITNHSWKQDTSSADMTQYEYDAFVSYDFNDFPWVKHELLVEMEQKRNFKLCVAQRDFHGGDILHETIVDHIDKSRKTILLLTPDFIKSQWCEFEFSIAMNKRVDSGKDIIVAVILKPLPSGSVSGSLYHVLKKKLYLEWVKDDDTARSLFWRKLSDALKQQFET